MNLDQLARGFPHIPRVCGKMMAQAGAVCLDSQKHVCGVHLITEGAHSKTYEVHWSEAVTDPMRRFWNDLDVATEHGAYGVAILLIRAFTGYTVIERAKKGTGVDWWLGNEDNLFQAKARLEVSGILKGDAKRISSRVSVKKNQSRQSDDHELPAYVVVVEFGTPRSRVVQREAN